MEVAQLTTHTVALLKLHRDMYCQSCSSPTSLMSKCNILFVLLRLTSGARMGVKMGDQIRFHE